MSRLQTLGIITGFVCYSSFYLALTLCHQNRNGYGWRCSPFRSIGEGATASKIDLKPENEQFDFITVEKGINEVVCIGEYVGLIRFAK